MHVPPETMHMSVETCLAPRAPVRENWTKGRSEKHYCLLLVIISLVNSVMCLGIELNYEHKEMLSSIGHLGKKYRDGCRKSKRRPCLDLQPFTSVNVKSVAWHWMLYLRHTK